MLHHIRTLHKALAHIQHHASYIDRAEAIYAIGLLHLAALFYFPSSTFRSKQWRSAFANSGFTPTITPFPSFLPPTQSTSNFISTLMTPNGAITSTAIATWAPPPSASQAKNTTGEPNSNNWPRTHPFPQNYPSATGTPPTPLPTFPPFTLRHTRIWTRPGSMNTSTSLNGIPHLTGPTSHST